MSLLIKFGLKEHLEQLQEEGLLYCKPVLEFARMEADKARGDKLENVIKLSVIERPKIRLRPKNDADAEFRELKITHAQERLSDNKYQGNLFCMSLFPIQEDSKSFEIKLNNPSFRELGTHYLLILNQPEFFKRIDQALTKEGIDYERRCVDYLNFKNFTGVKSIFQKDQFFNWQSEYRIFLHTGKEVLHKSSIGSLGDISILGELKETTSFEILRSTKE